MSEAMPVGGLEPHPMIPQLESILTHWQESRPRSQQTKLGPSEIGDPCGRKLALRLVNPRSKAGLKWAALLGVWAHAGLEEALRAWNEVEGHERYLVEHRVEADDDVRSGVDEFGVGGSTDNYDTWTDEVIDWKVVGKESLTSYRTKGDPGDQYRVQAHTYGLGWERRGFTPRSVRVVFLPRWSNKIRDGWEWSEPYDPSVALDALERVKRLGAQADEATRGEIGWDAIEAHPVPYKCAHFCPYFRPEVAPDVDGCPGHTRVPLALSDKIRACSSTAEIKGLWYELRSLGALDPDTADVLGEVGKTVKALEERGDAGDEIAAVISLAAAGFHHGSS